MESIPDPIPPPLWRLCCIKAFAHVREYVRTIHVITPSRFATPSNKTMCRNPSFRLMIKARACKGVSQKCRRLWRNEPTHSEVGSHFGSWSPEFLESNCRGQNSLDWRVHYTIEKILERRCLKWVCTFHLST